jgi:UDP:flavonoid glycosyltransferase YjiC (YdhE family)
MRVLCSAVPLEGHVLPILPIATALTRAGHDVRFATGVDLHARIRQAGLIPIAAGPRMVDAMAAAECDPRFADFSLSERGGATFSQLIAPAKLLDLDRILAEWRPDVVIHECTDLAAPIAAAAAGVPSVTQGWGLVPTTGEWFTPLVADVAGLWREHGLEPDPYAGSFRGLYLHPLPRGMEPDARVPVGRLQPMRLDPPLEPGAKLPDWADALRRRGRPMVYVTLGTHPYFSQPGYFRTILDGLAELDIDVVATIGEHNDPLKLELCPENVHVERWLPISLLLPLCSLTVCHAGSGTLLASLSAGVPLVLLPRGADQFANASASERAGVGRALLADRLTPEAIAAEVAHVLDDSAYSRAAARLRAEIDAMPAPYTVVPILEDWVRNGS